MYHIIKTKAGSTLILRPGNASYQRNLAECEGNIDAEAMVDKLPDGEVSDWSIGNEGVFVDPEKRKVRLLLLKLSELATATDAAHIPHLRAYSSAEIQTWQVQENEALSWLADTSAPTPIIDAIISSTPKDIYCAKIINNANSFRRNLEIIRHSISIRAAIKLMDIPALEAVEPARLLQNALMAPNSHVE